MAWSCRHLFETLFEIVEPVHMGNNRADIDTPRGEEIPYPVPRVKHLSTADSMHLCALEDHALQNQTDQERSGLTFPFQLELAVFTVSGGE